MVSKLKLTWAGQTRVAGSDKSKKGGKKQPKNDDPYAAKQHKEKPQEDPDVVEARISELAGSARAPKGWKCKQCQTISDNKVDPCPVCGQPRETKTPVKPAQE